MPLLYSGVLLGGDHWFWCRAEGAGAVAYALRALRRVTLGQHAGGQQMAGNYFGPGPRLARDGVERRVAIFIPYRFQYPAFGAAWWLVDLGDD